MKRKNISNLKLSKQSGITLVALVITVIVLLILAGITIVTLTGDNGLLVKANKAVRNTKKAEYIEVLSLAAIQTEDLEEMKTEIEKYQNIKVSEYKEYNGNLVVITEDGYKFLIDKKKVLAVEILNIEYGNIEIYPDYYILNDENISNDDKNYIITGSTTENSVKIFGDQSNTYNIYISDLTIDVKSISNLAAFNIKEGANVNLNVMGENTFTSGFGCAGLQKSSKDGNLIIEGVGKLTTSGGQQGPGIGRPVMIHGMEQFHHVLM